MYKQREHSPTLAASCPKLLPTIPVHIQVLEAELTQVASTKAPILTHVADAQGRVAIARAKRWMNEVRIFVIDELIVTQFSKQCSTME